MAGKKHIPGKSAKPQNHSANFPGAHAQIKKTEDQSFWQRVLEDKPRLFLYQKVCIFMVAFLVFANGIPNAFNMDDVYYTTKENPVAGMGIKAIPKIFTTHTLYDISKNNFDYRPIAMLSFVLQHQFLGSSAPVSHFINVLIYSFICLFFFVLLCRWFGPEKSWFAFFVTLLYAVHPLHTEVVDNIKNRDELLATFFGILSMLYIWKWHKTGKTWYIILSVFLFIIGLLCKKTIIAYVAIIPMAFYFFTDMPLKKIALQYVTLCTSLIISLRLINHSLPEQKRIFLFFENPMYVTHLPLGIKTATASYILGWYSYLHVIPYPLSFYYGYKYVQLLNWNNLLPVLSLIIYLLLIYLVIKNIRKKSIAAFGALFYIVCTFMYSNLFGVVPGMMAERYTFDSSLGYSILFISALYYLYKIIPGIAPANKKSKYMLPTFLFVFISYAGMSIARNTKWENKWVLYNHDIKHLQNSAKANMLYGELVILKTNYWRQKFDQAPDAEKQIYRDSILEYLADEKLPFLRVLAIAPSYNKAMNNLAIAYIHDDSFEIAKKYLLQARAVTPDSSDDPNTHYNLGIVYGNLGVIKNNDALLLDSSINEFKTVVRLKPNYTTAYRMLGLTYLVRKDTASAVNILRLGIQNVPDLSFLYTELAKVYLYKRDTSTAISYYEKGANVPHPDPGLFQMLQGYFHSKNDIQKEAYYRNKANAMHSYANQDN